MMKKDTSKRNKKTLRIQTPEAALAASLPGWSGTSKAMTGLIGFHLDLASCIDSNRELSDSNL